MHDYDVIIAGGGPAGATSAYFLARAGKHVLVVEKEALPRYKPCGGGLSLDFLKTIFPFSFDAVIEKRIDLVHYHYDGFQADVACRPNVMAMVMRSNFDKFILDQAGCEVLQSESVSKVEESESGVTITLASGKEISADHLIAADGANSIIRRLSGLHRKQRSIAAIEAEIPLTEPLKARYSGGPIFIFDKPRAGYSWIFPKTDYLSVGIGVLGHAPDLRGELGRIMESYGISLDGVTYARPPDTGL